MKILYYIGGIVTLSLLVLWHKFPNFTEWEPLVAIWVFLQSSVIVIQKRRIDYLEYSPALSLAHGYVNNFLEPAVIQLEAKGNTIDFNVFLPDTLGDLSEVQIERMKSQIESKGFRLGEIKLKRKIGRPHDILTIERRNGLQSYFDFPRTLLSLQSYLDYKISSSANESTDKKKSELAEKLVNAFKNEIERLVKEKNLDSSVRFVGKNLSDLESKEQES